MSRRMIAACGYEYDDEWMSEMRRESMSDQEWRKGELRGSRDDFGSSVNMDMTPIYQNMHGDWEMIRLHQHDAYGSTTRL